MVDCPTQLNLVTWICQLCSMTDTSEKYERTQQGNLLGAIHIYVDNRLRTGEVPFSMTSCVNSPIWRGH